MAGSTYFKVTHTCPSCRETVVHECGKGAAPLAGELNVDRLLKDIAARIRSGVYLTYHAGPDNLIRDALDAEYARLSRPSDEVKP